MFTAPTEQSDVTNQEDNEENVDYVHNQASVTYHIRSTEKDFINAKVSFNRDHNFTSRLRSCLQSDFKKKFGKILSYRILTSARIESLKKSVAPPTI